MAEVKIDIPGIGEVVATNAASESTLRELLKAMGGRKIGGGPGQQNNNNGNIDKESAEAVEALGEKSGEAAKEVEGLGGAISSFVGGAWNLFTAAIGATVGSVVGLGTELIAGGNRLSDFTQYLPIPGLTQFAGLLDGQVDLFRELSSTGATFGNNMFEITRIAGNAAIPQQEFAELLKTNSESLRMFGSTVGDGARQFAGMSKEMRQGGIGPQLMSMGMTTTELNENLIDYNQMMQVSGRRQFMSQSQLIEGAQNYSLELDKLSKLTGKSREQLAEEMKQKNLDIRRQMAINRLGEEFGLRLQQAAETSPKLEAALLDMADGVANDPLTRQLMANNEAFAREAQNIQNMSATQMNNFIRRVADDGRAYANTLGEAGVQASMANGTAVGEYAAMVGELQTSRETMEGAVEGEQGARDDATAALTTLSETINDIRGQIQTNIIDSQIFQDIKNGITDMIPSTEEAKDMFAEVSRVFNENVMPNIDAFWNWLKGDGYTLMTDAIGDTWNWLKDVAWPNIKEMFETLSNLWTEYGPAIKTFFTDLFNDPGKVWDDTIWPLITDGMTNLFTDFDWVAFGGTLLLAMTKLNPFGALASTLIAGVVGFIGWENIKQYFSATTLGEKLTDAVSGLFNWITGLFDFDFGAMVDSVIPDWAKRFLPDSWFAGPSSTGGGTGPSAADAIPEASESSSTTATTTTPEPVRTASNATSTEEITLATLNTNTARMIELLEIQNRLLRQSNGNLYS